MSAVLQEVEELVGGLAGEVGPKVVGVGRFGSGVIIADGTILTNAHVVRREDVQVRFGDERTAAGTLTGIDAERDLAVISTDTEGVRPIEWADATPAIGAAVVAVANPGGRGVRATLGFVSSTGRGFRGPRGRRQRDTLEHTAPLPRGSSGSPVVDRHGRLLGLNTIRLEGGLIAAIAATPELHEHVQALARGESPSRAMLGLALAPPRVARRLRRAVGLPERDGLLVRGVAEDGPAARAGVEQGDLIVGVGGKAIGGIDDLYEQLDRSSSGGTLELELVRGAAERNVEVRLG
jgi:S1-C subfamily serine protease